MFTNTTGGSEVGQRWKFLVELGRSDFNSRFAPHLPGGKVP